MNTPFRSPSNFILTTCFVVLTFLASGLVSAQKKQLTLEDAVLGRYSKFNPENLSRMSWINEGSKYSWLDENELKQSDVKGTTSTLLKLDDLNASFKRTTGEELSRFPYLRWLSDQQFRFSNESKLYTYDLTSKKTELVNEWDADAENLDIHPKTHHVAYTKANNLYIRPANSAEIAISNEADPGIVYGQAVHRSEFGIQNGTFWSETGKKLAFYRMDERMVTDYPLIDMTTRVATLNNIKYPMAGMKSHEVTIGVYDVASGKTIYLKTGEPKEQYLTNISWSPDDKFIYVAIVNRDQNHTQWKQFDANSGELVKLLFEEKDEKFTEPENPVYTIPSTKDLLFFSNRDGYKQLYIYSVKSGNIKRISKGSFDITQFKDFDQKGSTCYFMGATNRGMDRQLFSLNLKNGKQSQLTSASGVHSVAINASGYILDSYSSISVPRKIDLLNSKGKSVRSLLKAENPMKEYDFATTELVTVKNKEGIEFNSRIIKPDNFDPKKKYPVIVYVYGGPHAQLVTNSWLGAASMWMHYIAQKGYIVFTLDNRGSHNRGVEFSRATFRQLGTKEMEDQLSGVDYLKSLPYVDQNRMAVHGWSFGGFMTSSLMLRQPGTFKVGVAGGPVIDWSMYEVMYGERYMDTPEQNPEGYSKSDVSQYVENLQGDLLIIHGQVDPVVVPQHSMKLLKASVDKGVQIDFFTYPGHPHNVRGKDRVHLMKKVLDYIEDKLN